MTENWDLRTELAVTINGIVEYDAAHVATVNDLTLGPARSPGTYGLTQSHDALNFAHFFDGSGFIEVRPPRGAVFEVR